MKRFLQIYSFIFLVFFALDAAAVGSLIVAAVVGAESIAALTFTQMAIATAINFGISQIVSRVFAPKLETPDVSRGADNGVRIQVPPSTTNSIPIVYGDAYIGGMFSDAILNNGQNVMYYVMPISAVSPNGQFIYDTSKFYYGDRKVTMTGVNVIALEDGSGNVETELADNIKIYLYTSDHLGNITPHNTTLTPAQVINQPDVNSNVWWKSTTKMTGLAFAIVRLEYSRADGATQLDPITFYVSHYLNSKGAALPGDVWVDYMTNFKYGAAISLNNVNADSATALNNYSNELITYTNNNGQSAQQARYRINGVIDTSNNCLKNIDDILIACDSWMTYNAAFGQWAIVINKPENVAMNFNDNNIVSDIRVSATDITQSINQIEMKFPSKLNRDQYDYVNLSTPSNLRYANEPDNKYSSSIEMTNDSVQAQYLANRILEQAREDLIVSIKTTYEGIQINAGDVVTITNAAYGWSFKKFRVTKVNEASLPDGNLGASLELNEYNELVYDNKSITQYSPTPNSYLSSPNFFSTLNPPSYFTSNPTDAVPNFGFSVITPNVGRITSVTLFYTTAEYPSPSDWQVWGTQVSTVQTTIQPNDAVFFLNISLPANTYRFAYKVSNEIATSNLSLVSDPFVWLPNPQTTGVTGTFSSTFSPAIINVPRANGVPNFTGITPQLWASAANGTIEYVQAANDADPLFVNNSWRIGASATTGVETIQTQYLGISAPQDAGSYAQFAEPYSMSGQPAIIEAPIRYKDINGNITQQSNARLFFYFIDSGTQGNSSRRAFAKTTSTLSPTPETFNTTGGISYPPNNTWGGNEIWVETAPQLSAGEYLYQSDAIYNPNTNITTWTVPYQSSLKVGSLEALTTNTGSLTVTGTMQSANGNFSVDANGDVTIRTATVGARLQITNNTIKVYDINGILRVKIGNLSL